MMIALYLLAAVGFICILPYVWDIIFTVVSFVVVAALTIAFLGSVIVGIPAILVWMH